VLRAGLKQKGCVMNSLKNFLADESGATAIEYGLIAAGIAKAIVNGGRHGRVEPAGHLHQPRGEAQITIAAAGLRSTGGRPLGGLIFFSGPVGRDMHRNSS